MNAFVKCPNCDCIFCTEHDLKKHLESFPIDKNEHANHFRQIHSRIEHVGDGDEHSRGWRKSKWGEGEWCFAEDEPRIASACRSNGKLTMNGFDITLDATGKYLRRRISSKF